MIVDIFVFATQQLFSLLLVINPQLSSNEQHSPLFSVQKSSLLAPGSLEL